MKKTIGQIEDKLYEVLNALDDFMDKYNDSLNGKAYELFNLTFNGVDDVLHYLNLMKSELEEGQTE
jgi:hypothetical protein